MRLAPRSARSSSSERAARVRTQISVCRHSPSPLQHTHLTRSKLGGNSTSAETGVAVLLSAALKYSPLFLVLQTAGLLAERTMGDLGFYAIRALGKLVSSASAVAAAAGVVSKGTISPGVGAVGVVLASLTSVLVNMPPVWRAKNPTLMRRLALAMTLVTIAGLAGAVVQIDRLGTFLR